MPTYADRFNPYRRARIENLEFTAQQAKIFRSLTERALNMLWLACPETRQLSLGSRNPVAAWVTDAQKALSDADGPQGG